MRLTQMSSIEIFAWEMWKCGDRGEPSVNRQAFNRGRGGGELAGRGEAVDGAGKFLLERDCGSGIRWPTRR